MLKNAMLLCTLLCGALSLLTANTDPSWQVEMDGQVNWTKLTGGGILIVQHGNQISGIDPESKSVAWSTKLGISEIAADDVQEIPVSPYITIERPAGLIASKLMIVDYFTGKTVFDSKEADVPRILESYPMFEAGGILLRTKGDGKQVALVFIDFKTSTVRWSLSIDQKPESLGIGGMIRMMKAAFTPRPILDPDNNIIYPTRRELMRIDAQTGKPMWNLDLKKIEDLYYGAESKQTLYVAFDKNKFSAINLKDGSEVWSKPIKLKGDFSSMFPHGKGLIVVQTALISKIDAATGKDMWKKEPKPVNTYNYLLDNQNHMFVVSEDGKDKALINAYDLNSGEEAWKKDIKVKAPVEGFTFTPKGILYLSGGGSNIINPSDGQEYWKKDLKLKGQPIFLNDAEESAYLVYGKGKLYRINTQSGDFELLLEDIKFQGKEDVDFIEKRAEGYLLGSSQNYMLVSPKGKVLHQTYLPAHTGSFASKLAAASLYAASKVYMYDQSYKAMGNLGGGMTNAMLGDEAKSQEMFNKTEKQLNRAVMASNTSVAAEQTYDQLMIRFKSSFESQSDAFILTSDKGVVNKPIFVRIDKDQGEEIARYDLKNAEPIYDLDEIGRLLYIANGKTIEVYTL